MAKVEDKVGESKDMESKDGESKDREIKMKILRESRKRLSQTGRPVYEKEITQSEDVRVCVCV